MTPRLWSFETSPFAGKARAAFAEKGVAVEVVEIHPRRRPARLRELFAANTVPVLELPGHGTAIGESQAICEWLEETHPDPPLWPGDPVARGWARAWTLWLDARPTRAFFVGMRKLAFGRAPTDPEDVHEHLFAELPHYWPKLEQALQRHDGPYLCGEQVSFADVAGLALAVRIPQWNAPLAPGAGEFPAVAAWLEALRARPSAAAIEQRGAGERLEG